jgi:hypothetical protein
MLFLRTRQGKARHDKTKQGKTPPTCRYRRNRQRQKTSTPKPGKFSSCPGAVYIFKILPLWYVDRFLIDFGFILEANSLQNPSQNLRKKWLNFETVFKWIFNGFWIPKWPPKVLRVPAPPLVFTGFTKSSWKFYSEVEIRGCFLAAVKVWEPTPLPSGFPLLPSHLPPHFCHFSAWACKTRLVFF